MKKIINIILILLSIIIMAVLTTGVLEGDIALGINNTFISGDQIITNIIGVQNDTDVSFTGINSTNGLEVTGTAYINGNVGIGTNNPLVNLHSFLSGSVYTPNVNMAYTMQNSGTTGSIVLMGLVSGDDGQSVISGGIESNDILNRIIMRPDQDASPDPSIGFLVDGVEMFKVEKTRVGIGTTNPLTTLDVNSGNRNNGLLINGTDNREVIQLADDDTSVYMVAEGSVFSLGLIALRSINNLNILLNKVGIGTINPDSNLHVVETSNTQSANISLWADRGDNNNDKWTITAFDNSRLDFANNEAGSIMTISTAGNVGIGTSLPTKKLHVIGDVNISQNITANFIYGEMAFHNDTLFHIVAIATQNVYVNITGFDGSDTEEFLTLNGFTFNSEFNALICDVSGLYKVDYSISTGNDGNNQEYEFTIAVNNVLQNSTDTHRKIGASGDVGNSGSSGFINCNAGNRINLQAVNRDGTSNLRVHSANVNLIRIGD